MRRKFTKYPSKILASAGQRFEFMVQRYENEAPEMEVVIAKNLKEAEDKLNNDEYVEWWDYYDYNKAF